MPTEILTFGASTLIGGFLKIWARKMEADRIAHAQNVEKAQLLEQSRSRAQSNFGGRWSRRLIVVAVLFAVFIAPFLILFFEPTIPVSYAYEEAAPRFLGIFGSGADKLKYITLQGYVILPIHSHMASAIAGFYFGSGAVGR